MSTKHQTEDPRLIGTHRGAMTLFEVMIAIAVMTVALFAMLSTVASFRGVQVDSDIDRRVHLLAQTMTERLMGGDWEQLGTWKNDIISSKDGTTVVDKTHNGLTWHRRRVPRTTNTPTTPGFTSSALVSWSTTALSPRLPPLQENSKYGTDHDLLYQLANTEQRSFADKGGRLVPLGIPNVKVYVEYYASTLLDEQILSAAVPQTAWKKWTQGTLGVGPPSDLYVLGESPGGTVPAYAADPSTAMWKVSLTVPLCIRVCITWGPDKAPQAHVYETVIVRRR